MTRVALLTAELEEAQAQFRQASYAEQLHPYGSDDYKAAREETVSWARRVRYAREELESEKERAA